MTSKTITRAGVALAAASAVAFAAGCAGATGHPGPISASELAEARTFPYYRTYWVGRSFDGQRLVAADGRRGYNGTLGDSVYYGDCVRGKGLFGGGSCTLPLQVTTVIYRLHGNAALGPQRNLVLRGVPATVYDGGHSIELYSGRVAIDVFSDTFAHARKAALSLLPLNARGSLTTPLPRPVYCPGLFGPEGPELRRLLANLPGHPCQRAAAALAFAGSLRLGTASHPSRVQPRSRVRERESG